MTIQEKVEMQKGNTATVYLHREGIFYKAYNEGAFMLNFLKYKVSSKYIKNINQRVYSIGFPLAVLDKLAAAYTISNQNTVQMIDPIEVFTPLLVPALSSDRLFTCKPAQTKNK